MERTIRVTGKGKISVKPDTIRLRINMEGIYPEYDETLQKSSEAVEQLKDLQRLGRILYALARCPISPEFSIDYSWGEIDFVSKPLQSI